MKIFMAAVANRRAVGATRAMGVKNYLLSFAGGKNSFDINADAIADPQCSLLVDSGAFSAWNNGVSIDIYKLIQFCHEIKKTSQCQMTFINLDVIPGSRNVRPTQNEREESARKSWINSQIMRSAGLEVMPVFHQHESFRWLEKMAEEYGYFGVSPANDCSVKERDEWLDLVFRIIKATRKTHAFGVTATELLARYPFYSADSTTWLNGAKYATYVALIPERAQVVQIQRTEFYRNKKYLAQDIVKFKNDLTYRYLIGIRTFLRYEKLVTKLWARRGVTWES